MNVLHQGERPKHLVAEVSKIKAREHNWRVE